MFIFQRHFKVKNIFNAADDNLPLYQINANNVFILKFKFKFREKVKIVTKMYEHPLYNRHKSFLNLHQENKD